MREVDDANAVERRGRPAVRHVVGARRLEGCRAAITRGLGRQRRAAQHDRLSQLGSRSERGIENVGDRMAVASTLVGSQPLASRLADRARCPGALVDVVLPLGRVPSAEQLGESLDQLDLQLGISPEPIGLGDTFGEPLRHELLREPPHVPVLEEAEVKPAAVLALVVPETRPRRRLERTRGHVVRHLQLVAEYLIRRVEQRHLDTLASPRLIAGEQRGHDVSAAIAAAYVDRSGVAVNEGSVSVIGPAGPKRRGGR